MKLIDGNLVKTVIQFGKDMLGVELEEKQVSSVIKSLSFSENIQLANSLKNDNLEKFSEILEIEPQQDTNEAYGTIGTQQASGSSIDDQAAKQRTDSRRFTNTQQDAARDATAVQRTVAGGNKQPTGQGAARYDKRANPDDVQSAQNAQTANFAATQAQKNAAEIERLKQLALGRR
jgi:hypothetical protein